MKNMGLCLFIYLFLGFFVPLFIVSFIAICKTLSYLLIFLMAAFSYHLVIKYYYILSRISKSENVSIKITFTGLSFTMLRRGSAVSVLSKCMGRTSDNSLDSYVR